MTSHHCSLLQALARNAHKFSRPSVTYPSVGSPAEVFRHEPSGARMLDYRQRFESQLLILVTRDLTPASIQSLPSRDAEELKQGLDTLFDYLDHLSNETFWPGHIDERSTASTSEPHSIHPHLRYVLSLLDESQELVDLSGNTKSSLFRVTTLDHAKYAHTIVTKVNRILQQSQFTTSEGSIPLAANGNSCTLEAFNDRIRSFGHASNRRLGRLLDAIKADFEACETSACDKPHGVRIQLLCYDTHDSDSQESLDTCLYCPRTGEWQVARCEIDTDLYSRTHEHTPLCRHMQTSQNLNENLGLMFHENSSFFSPHAAPFDSPYGPSSINLKDLIEIHHSFGLPVIGERFKTEERRALAAKLVLHLSIFCPWRHTSVPWESTSVFFLRSALGDVDRTSPYIAWQVGHDSSTAFRAHKRANSNGNKREASIDSKKARAAEEAEAADDAEKSGIETLARCFTSFAKLLLEIEYGNMSNTGYPLDEKSLGKSLRKYHDELRKNADPVTHGRYLQAVDACLRFHWAFEQARLYQSVSRRVENPEEPEDTYRRLVRTEIASKIIINLLDLNGPPIKRDNHDPGVSEEDDSSSESDFEIVDDEDVPRYHEALVSPSAFPATRYIAQFAQSLMPRQPWYHFHTPPYASPRYDSSIDQPTSQPSPDPMPSNSRHSHVISRASTPQAVYPSVVPASSANLVGTTLVPPTISISGYSPNAEIEEVIQSLSDLETGCLLDEESDPDSLGAQQRETDRWFNNFVKLLQILKIGQAPGEPLRIAILDSGIDFYNEEFDNEERDRIAIRETFIGSDPDVDQVGHGTHVAAIILRLTVNVDLYIAKVTDSDRPRKDAVVKALERARTEWKVNMVSLSFGFEQVAPADGLKTEIDLCVQNSILVFASASNDGAEGTRTYPAKFRDVVCVHASNQRGKSYERNPLPESISDLSFIGEQIRPVWGRSDLTNSTSMQYKNGTSYATPVAVSFAAFMIGFIRLKGWSEWPWMYEPWTPYGMGYILRMMSESTEIYRWVTPTKYFKKTRMATIETVLRERLVRGNFEPII